MGAVSIDELQIRISGTSTNAYASVDALIGALEKLQRIRIDGGIASAIDGIGKAASRASSKVSKMAGEFAKGAKAAVDFKRTFDWEYTPNWSTRGTRQQFETPWWQIAQQPGTSIVPFQDDMIDGMGAIDAEWVDVTDAVEVGVRDIIGLGTPMLTMAQDVVTGFNEITTASDATLLVWRNNARVLEGLSAPERTQGIKDAMAAFTEADWAKYNPSFAFFNSIENGFAHLKQKAKETAKSMDTFFKSIQRIATYRLIRSALKAITSGFREGIQNLAQYSKAIGETDTWAANSVMSEYATKFLEVKNAVGAAAMPVLVALQPVIISIANAFIYATNALNMFFSALGGSGTYTKAQTAAVDYAATLDKSSAGASKAAKQLSAGFDELNVLSDNSGSGGGGGSTNGMPDFKDMFSENMIPKWLIDNLQLIKDLVIAIGIGLLAWKISSLFTDSLSKIAGLALAAAGAFLLGKGAIDAWENGVNWTNLMEMVGGTALLAIGLGMAFGAVGAAIGLLVGGVTMLVIGIKDWITTGELSTETFWLLEAGIVAVGVALAILAGPVGWIPAIVAAVAALALAVYKYSDEIKAFVFKCIDFIKEKWEIFKNWFADLWEKIKTNLSEKWNAIKTFFTVIIPQIISKIVTFFGELPGKIKEKIDQVKETIATWATSAVEWVKENVPKIINAITDWFAKLPEALVNVGKNMVKGIWNGMLQMKDWLWQKLVGFLGNLGEFAEDILGSFGGGGSEGYDAIPQYASGGVVGSGQMFLARENGMPELVGSIGGSTAVMNNDQIVAAVAGGVYDAVVSAMSQTNGKSQSIQVFLDGKQIEASTRNTKQRRGASIATGGIYNFA